MGWTASLVTPSDRSRSQEIVEIDYSDLSNEELETSSPSRKDRLRPEEAASHTYPSRRWLRARSA